MGAYLLAPFVNASTNLSQLRDSVLVIVALFSGVWSGAAMVCVILDMGLFKALLALLTRRSAILRCTSCAGTCRRRVAAHHVHVSAAQEGWGVAPARSRSAPVTTLTPGRLSKSIPGSPSQAVSTGRGVSLP